MANEQPKVQYTLEAITKHLELLRQSPDMPIMPTNKQHQEESSSSDATEETIDFEKEKVFESPSTSNVINIPDFEKLIVDDEEFIEAPTKSIEVPRFKETTSSDSSKEYLLMKETIPEVKSEKARLITAPKLIINDLKILINQKRINKKLNLGRRPKISSALAHLAILPVGVVVLAKEAIKERIQDAQFRYGDWYYNEYLVNKEEKERLKNIKFAEELEQKRIDKEYKIVRKENSRAVIDSLNDADKQKIADQKERYQRLKSMHL